jgi:hypothetical protein
MLPAQPPAELETLWPEDYEIAEQRRYYQFESLPTNVFSQLMSRFFNLPGFEVKCYWRHGIVLHQQHTATVLLELDVANSTLQLRVRGPQQVVKLVDLDEPVDTFFKEWLRIPFEVKIPCRHCLQEGRERDAHLFARVDLEEAVQRTHPFVSCVAGKKPRAVRVEWLVPDIAMTTFSGEKIEFKEIELGKVIGEGAFATVSEGYWRGNHVAVKQLKLTSMASREDNNIFSDFRREVFLMSGLQNENLVVLKAITMEPFCMVLDYMEKGSLYEYLHNPTNKIDWVRNCCIGSSSQSRISNQPCFRFSASSLRTT